MPPGLDMARKASGERTPGQPARTMMRPMRVGGIWILIGVVAGLVVFGTFTATAPFGQGSIMASLCHYNEVYAEAWKDFGFIRSLGVPMMDAVGETVPDRLPYAHMPPAGWWVPYAGRSLIDDRTLAYKIFPTILSCLGMLVIFGLVARQSTPGWGALFAALWMSCPAVLVYAALPGVEATTLFFSAVMLFLWERWHTRPDRSRIVVAFVWFLIGCQVAWPFYFIAPGIWAAELLRSRQDRRLGSALLLLPTGILGFIIVVLHLILGVGDAQMVFDDLWNTIGNTGAQALHDTGAGGDFMASIVPMSTTHFGTVGAIAFAACVLLAIALPRWRRDPLTRIGAALLGPGILSVVVFNGRSTTHGYYYFLAAAPCAIFLLQGARMVSAELSRTVTPRSAVCIGVILVLGIAILGAVEVWPLKEASERTGLEESARVVDAFVPPDTWICCHDLSLHDVAIYSRRRWTPHWPWQSHVGRLLEHRDRGLASMRQLLVVLDPETVKAFPEYVKWLEEEERKRGGRRVHIPNDPRVYVFL